MDKQQKILKKFYDNKQDIKVEGRIFPVRKARTCRNCYFYRDCIFPQKPNPNYRMNDFENPKNRYELIPDGYCIPVKYFIGFMDYPGHHVAIAVDEILKLAL